MNLPALRTVLVSYPPPPFTPSLCFFSFEHFRVLLYGKYEVSSKVYGIIVLADRRFDSAFEFKMFGLLTAIWRVLVDVLLFWQTVGNPSG